MTLQEHPIIEIAKGGLPDPSQYQFSEITVVVNYQGETYGVVFVKNLTVPGWHYSMTTKSSPF